MKVYLFTIMIQRTLDIHFNNMDNCLEIWNIWMFQEQNTLFCNLTFYMIQ